LALAGDQLVSICSWTTSVRSATRAKLSVRLGGKGFQRTVATAIAALSFAAVGASAQASTWVVNYTSFQGAPTEASLTLNVSDSSNALGAHDVLGIINGQVDGDAISALTPNPGAPNATYSQDGWFIFDNNLWTSGAPYFSNPGLLFTSATAEYNLFSDSPNQYELYKAIPGRGYVANSVGTVTAYDPPAGVPEPATWGLMIMGFGGLGAMLRRRRGRVGLVA
jgi:hypothetical protein